MVDNMIPWRRCVRSCSLPNTKVVLMPIDTISAPIEKAQRLIMDHEIMKLAFYFTRRQFSKVLSTVESACRAVAGCLRSALYIYS
jgi:hypothetical protein